MWEKASSPKPYCFLSIIIANNVCSLSCVCQCYCYFRRSSEHLQPNPSIIPDDYIFFLDYSNQHSFLILLDSLQNLPKKYYYGHSILIILHCVTAPFRLIVHSYIIHRWWSQFTCCKFWISFRDSYAVPVPPNTLCRFPLSITLPTLYHSLSPLYIYSYSFIPSVVFWFLCINS